jgi:hypothetical protein
MFGTKNSDEQFHITLPDFRRIVVTKTEIQLGKESLSLAGAKAEVTGSQSGVFGRTTTSALVITAADGRQILYTYGGGFGTKGKASRRSAGSLQKVAVRINNAAIEAKVSLNGG